MKKLDQYIVGKYLGTFFFVLLILSLIVMAVDFSEKVEDFITQPCTKAQILGDHYLGFLMHMAGMLFPLYALVSVMFFTSRMASQSEIISILNAGVSFRRFLRPYIWTAVGLSGLHLFMNHWLVPELNKRRLKFEHTFICRDKNNCDKAKTANLHLFLSPDVKVYMKYFQKSDSSARDFRLERFEKGRLASLLEAKQARWKPKEQKWELSYFTIRDFDGQKEKLRLGTASQIDTAIDLRPRDLIRYKNELERRTTAELNEQIAIDQRRGLSNKDFEIERHRRSADAFTVLLLTLIGVPIASRKVRGGIGLHLAIGVGIGSLFILLSKFSISFAVSGSMPIALGMWLPNIFFAVVAAVLLARAQK
jgi:lipopolysaccharide export system permease protein